MRQFVRELTWGLATLLLGLAAVRRWQDVVAIPFVAVSVSVVPTLAREYPHPDSLTAAAERIAHSDVFLLGRAPVIGEIVAPVETGRPATSAQLVLKAIVGGPPWQAVLDGVPGEPPGTVVEAGSDIGGFRVFAISRDSVVIGRRDSTWTLTLSRVSR